MSVPRPANGAEVAAALAQMAQERILVLDGAMGTEIQALKLSEAEFRGERFKDHGNDVRGNNDLINLTQPDALRDIHLAYFRAGRELDAAGAGRDGGPRVRQARRRRRAGDVRGA